MADRIYLSTSELNEIAAKLAGTDGSLDEAVADEYGIDDTEIDGIMRGRDYERSDGELWHERSPFHI